MQNVEVNDQVNLFSEYPQEMEKYFSERDLYVKVIPTEFVRIEGEIPDIKIGTVKEFYNYLNGEIEFWNCQDKERKLIAISQRDRLNSAKSNLDSALSSYKTKNYVQGENMIRQSINSILYGSLYSETKMATFVLQYKSTSMEFLRGLRCGLIKNKANTQITSTVGDYEGFLAALSFLEYEKNIWKNLVNNGEELKKSSEEAINNYAALSADYVKAFHEQQDRIKSITDQTNKHLQDLRTDSEKYFAEKEKRCEDLEKLYAEHLKLKEPAQYWETMYENYNKNGRGWFIASVITAVVIIVGLVVLLLLLPTVFSQDSHWFEIFRNSAIITVITSIAVYILRILVKMTMSSYHLSRDAKERHNLTYFYLALINDRAITDKERALVINALFSRSDTGLLKNDAGPTMSNNVPDIVEAISK